MRENAVDDSLKNKTFAFKSSMISTVPKSINIRENAGKNNISALIS